MIETIPHPDRDALYKRFEEQPGDLTGYGVMADLLDEIGYDSLAHAYRWMSKRGKYPHRREEYCDRAGRKLRAVPAKFRWAWYHVEGPSLNVLPRAAGGAHCLPPLTIPTALMPFASHQAAVMALAKWLQRLKDTHDLEPRRAGL